MLHGLPQSDVDKIQNIGQVPDILELCCKVTGMRFSAVARVTDQSWLTCASLDHVGFGLKPGDDLPLQSTICDEIRQSRTLVAFNDSQQDDHFREHHTPRIYGLRSYISVPIILADGSFFGTLCAIDSEPREVNTPATITTFTLFADLIAGQLSAQADAASVKRALAIERETARLREEFIAVVGHDLRNPVAALSAGVSLLQRAEPPGQGLFILQQMATSIARMNGIIANLMDFARGRLGGGIVPEWRNDVSIRNVIDNIVAEIRTFSEHEIIIDLNVPATMSCDPQRIGQLLSNLIGNAITHGAPDRPVSITADVQSQGLVLQIRNIGEAIPPERMAGLFEPFRRGDSRYSDGLGLGLYISSEIARAHGGLLTARAEVDGTSFVFTMPLSPAGEEPSTAW